MAAKTKTQTMLLGLDTSSSCCGYSLFRGRTLVSMGRIDLNSSKPMAQRLAGLRDQLVALIDKHKVEVVAAEDLTHFTRGPVAKVLGAVLGVTWLVVWDVLKRDTVMIHPATMGKYAKLGVPAIEYEHVAVKQRKKKIQRLWANKTYGLEDKAANQDVADALLVGHIAVHEV